MYLIYYVNNLIGDTRHLIETLNNVKCYIKKSNYSTTTNELTTTD